MLPFIKQLLGYNRFGILCLVFGALVFLATRVLGIVYPAEANIFGFTAAALAFACYSAWYGSLKNYGGMVMSLVGVVLMALGSRFDSYGYNSCFLTDLIEGLALLC